MSQDPLHYLPLEKWSELQSVFKTEWPRSISGYAALDTQRSWIEQGLDYGFKVYCPYGDMWNGMVAINEKGQSYEIVIICARNDTDKLEDALKNTKLINWQRPVKIPFAPPNTVECIQKISKHFELPIKTITTQTFILESPIFQDVFLPPNITFGLLSLEHVDLVDSNWPHRHSSSLCYFRLLIKSKSGYGLFEDNKLITWVFISETGILLHLCTVESHRGKGYAELIIKLISNILIKEGKPAIAFCVKGNVKAISLFNKLGFVQWGPASWCFTNKKE